MAKCHICNDELRTGSGRPCPVCCKDGERREVELPVCEDLPQQYQGIVYSKEFIPEALKNTLGSAMETLLIDIQQQGFCQNILIGARPNSGKTVWAYNVYARLMDKGWNIPKVRDIYEVQRILYSFSKDDEEESSRYNNAKVCIIKIPMDVRSNVVELMSTIVERRVRNGGVTIFLYGGTREELVASDKQRRLPALTGNGSFNTIDLKFYY